MNVLCDREHPVWSNQSEKAWSGCIFWTGPILVVNTKLKLEPDHPEEPGRLDLKKESIFWFDFCTAYACSCCFSTQRGCPENRPARLRPCIDSTFLIDLFFIHISDSILDLSAQGIPYRCTPQIV